MFDVYEDNYRFPNIGVVAADFLAELAASTMGDNVVFLDLYRIQHPRPSGYATLDHHEIASAEMTAAHMNIQAVQTANRQRFGRCHGTDRDANVRPAENPVATHENATNAR